MKTGQRFRTTVIITLLNDERVFRTLESLEKQTLKPDLVLIADGGSEQKLYIRLMDHAKHHDNVTVSIYKGSVSQTRNAVIKEYQTFKTDILAFIDSDEVAPPKWLERLIQPIEKGDADFTGGRTHGYPLDHKNKCQQFNDDFYEWFYDSVTKEDMTTLAMGNSAWKREIFDEIGNFDERISGGGGEDYDINMRAVSHGFIPMYVEEAWLYHDQSSLDTLGKIFKKKYQQSVWGTVTYLKNGTFESKSKDAMGVSVGYKHPIELANLFFKALGFIKGYMIWRRDFR